MRRTWFAILSAALALPLAAQSEVSVRPWAHADSDVPVHARVQFGHLANGMRYAWVENREPDERCYLRLHVDVGSLAETDAERGMAHFVEHMAFNGTRRFAAGELVDWFQAHGMDFGADTNAYTAHSETVYQIDLPETDAESVGEALLVLREFADGILFEEDQVEAEKGVIDAEERETDSAAYRMIRANNARRLAGTRFPVRDPIGVKPARDAFTAASLRAFYQRWYRPESTTLVLVGDLDGLDPTELITEHFADWHGEGEWSTAPPIGEPTMAQRSYSIYEDELPYYVAVVARLAPRRPVPVRKKVLIDELRLTCARAMLNLRLAELAKSADAAFLQAMVEGRGRPGAPTFRPPVFVGEALTVVASPSRWREALQQCDRELRRALEFGFRQAELDEIRSELARGLQEVLDREATRPSASLAGELAVAAEQAVVPVDAKTRRDLMLPALQAFTTDECHEALVESWARGELFVFGGGNLDLGEDAGGTLLEAYREGRATELEAPADIETKALDLALDGEPAEVVEQSHAEAVDAHVAVFGNGVRVVIKRTDFAQRQIVVRAYLGEGELAMEPDRCGLGLVASGVFDRAGLGSHSEDELRRALAGKLAGVGFSVAEDACVLSGSTTREDLALQCRLMCAYLVDPGWRAEAMQQFRKGLPEYYESLSRSFEGPFQMQFTPQLYGGDCRFGLAPREVVEGVSMDDVQAWLEPELASAPLSVCFVGDLDVEVVLETARDAFGRLPTRRPLERHEARRRVKGPRPGLEKRYVIDTDDKRATVIAVYPTNDGMELSRRVRHDLLGRVLGDRLLEAIREALGASYSPGAGAESSLVFPGVGRLTVFAQAEPNEVDALIAACGVVTDRLAEEGVTEEELLRLREPVMAQLRDERRANGFWAYVLLEHLHGREAALVEAVREVDAYQEVTAAELSELAADVLAAERRSLFVASPQER
ncbi:MAG: insulinase family protein [Planctomycetota bacterium]